MRGSSRDWAEHWIVVGIVDRVGCGPTWRFMRVDHPSNDSARTNRQEHHQRIVDSRPRQWGIDAAQWGDAAPVTHRPTRSAADPARDVAEEISHSAFVAGWRLHVRCGPPRQTAGALDVAA